MAQGVSLKESVKEMKRLKNEPLLLVVIVAIIAFVGLFVVYPVIRVILFPEAADYLTLFTKSRWFTAIKNSLFMTLISTVSCTGVAFLFAYVIARLDVPCKKLFRFVTLLPIVSPPFIVALSYILLFGVQGIVTKGLLGLQADIYGRFGLWIVQTVTFFPYAYSVIYNVITSISPNLEYAAYNMGASRWRVFRDVFLPLCRPGVAGGALMAAINVLTDFGNPMMIGGDLALLPTEAYMQISGWYDMKTASALAVALLLPAVGIFLINRFWVGRRSYVTITGKEVSLNPFPIPRWLKWLLFWNLPTCYSSATAGLQQIGASVEDAALNLGANSFRSFKDVIVPLLKGPFLSGFVLAFLRSVTCLSVVIFLYAPATTVGTISVMVLVQSGQWGEAAAFTTVLITIAFTTLKLAQWLFSKQNIKLKL